MLDRLTEVGSHLVGMALQGSLVFGGGGGAVRAVGHQEQKTVRLPG